MPSKKSLNVSFVTSGTQKCRGFSVFAPRKFPAFYNSLEAYCPKMNCFMCKIVHVKYHRNASAELHCPEARWENNRRINEISAKFYLNISDHYCVRVPWHISKSRSILLTFFLYQFQYVLSGILKVFLWMEKYPDVFASLHTTEVWQARASHWPHIFSSL